MCLSEVESGLNIFNKVCRFIGCIFKRKKCDEQEKKSQHPYYFEDYTKHVTVYKNGNGIIINSSTLVVTDIANFNRRIYRKLNIEDGKANNKFPALNKMMGVPKSERFDRFGFWYYSEDNIVEKVKEFYWSDTDKNREDKFIKKKEKEIRWYFGINGNRLTEGKKYQITYVISVEGLFPIENGVFNSAIMNDPNSAEGSSSGMEIAQNIKNFKYVVSFEDGIELESAPTGEICQQHYTDEKNITITGEHEYNVLFNKYTFSVNEPLLGSKIKIFWQFKNQAKEDADAMDRDGGC